MNSGSDVETALFSVREHLYRIYMKIKKSREINGLPISRTQMYQLKALSAFYADAEYTMGELSRHAMVQLPTMTEMVDRMERDGIVERTKSPEDRRVVKVKLTERGRFVHEQFMKTRSQELKRIFNQLDSTDRQALRSALQKVSQILGKVV